MPVSPINLRYLPWTHPFKFLSWQNASNPSLVWQSPCPMNSARYQPSCSYFLSRIDQPEGSFRFSTELEVGAARNAKKPSEVFLIVAQKYGSSSDTLMSRPALAGATASMPSATKLPIFIHLMVCLSSLVRGILDGPILKREALAPSGNRIGPVRGLVHLRQRLVRRRHRPTTRASRSRCPSR